MLIGEKVCLGPVLNSDAAQLFAWFDTFDIACASGTYRPASEHQFTQWLIASATDTTRVLFAVRRQGDLKLVGHVQIGNINAVFRSAEVGLGIGEKADRGQGLGQEALRLALIYCWRVLNLQRVALTVHGDNPWAQHAYAKAGFEVEGRLRRATYVHGRFEDVVLMAALRPEAV